MATRADRRQRSRMRHRRRIALLQPAKQIPCFQSGGRRERRSFYFSFQPDKRVICRGHRRQVYVRPDMSSTEIVIPDLHQIGFPVASTPLKSIKPWPAPPPSRRAALQPRSHNEPTPSESTAREFFANRRKFGTGKMRWIYNPSAPSSLARLRSKVPNGRWPAFRAASRIIQSANPNAGRLRYCSSAAATLSGS